jgi:hypothetical protein
MFKLICRRCGKSLKQPGALVFSPPKENLWAKGLVEKYHLCLDCWDILLCWLMFRTMQFDMRKRRKSKTCR